MAASSNAVLRERHPIWIACAVAAVVCGCTIEGTEVYPNGRPGGEGGAQAPVAGATGDHSGGTDVSAGGSDGTGGAATASGGSSPSTACAPSPPATPPSSVSVGGVERTFIVEIPAGYDSNTPTPIVFGFHGMATDGELFSSEFYGNLASALGDDFILVYPDALGNPTAWDMQGGADVEFFDTLLESISTTYCIDEDRIFATGHSSGGFFTNTLACQRGDVLRAIGPVSGGGPFVFDVACTGQVAAVIMHGTVDDTVALSNGQSSRDYWAGQNGCDLTQTTVPSPDYPCVEYAGCSAGFPVWWCEHPGGHDWPTFAPEALHDFFLLLPD